MNEHGRATRYQPAVAAPSDAISHGAEIRSSPETSTPDSAERSRHSTTGMRGNREVPLFRWGIDAGQSKEVGNEALARSCPVLAGCSHSHSQFRSSRGTDRK